MKLKRENDVLYIQINARWRILAKVLLTNELLIHKDSIENFVKKYEGYGFNYELMKEDRFQDLMFIKETDYTSTNVYSISRKKLLEIGTLGEETKFDRQIYISKDQLLKHFLTSTSNSKIDTES